MKVFVEWHGCPFSHIESRIAAERIGEVVDSPEKADVILLFTCIVKEETEKKMIRRIRELSGKRLIVGGCMVDVMPEKIKEIAPDALLLGTDHVDHAEDVLEKGKLLGFRNITKLGAAAPGEWPVAIVPISEGCIGQCTFCITKKARGRLWSYPVETVVEEVKRVVRLGYREIWLTAQDTAIYGIDRGEKLADLLDALLDLPYEFRIRVGMGDPSFFLRQWNRLKDLLHDSRVFKMIHAPVQSGSNRVLRDMRRMHTAQDFIRLAGKFYAQFPEGSVHTDIIVGYPTETEKDFEKTLELIKKARPYKVNVSRYGRRPGTEAEPLKKIPGWIVQNRSRRASSLARKVALKLNMELIGSRVNVFVDENNAGRTEGYRQVLVKREKGKTVSVRIAGATAGYLIAKGFYA